MLVFGCLYLSHFQTQLLFKFRDGLHVESAFSSLLFYELFEFLNLSFVEFGLSSQLHVLVVTSIHLFDLLV